LVAVTAAINSFFVEKFEGLIRYRKFFACEICVMALAFSSGMGLGKPGMAFSSLSFAANEM